MNSGRFDSTKVSLQDLLRDIQHARTQLPDFQRGWVWDDDHVRSLIASISLAFPIGAVLLLETGNPLVRFRPRPIEGVRTEPVQPERLILDGQQRLTSLYQALVMDEPVSTTDAKKNSIRRWYYVDIARALDPATDREDAIVGVPADRIVRNFRGEVILDLATQEKECEAGYLPVNLMFETAKLTQWQMTFVGTDAVLVPERLGRWNRVLEEVVQPFQGYQMPQILLGKETSKEAVCKVFEKVNTGGVSLTVFELLTATYAVDDYSLRDDWADRARRLHKHRVLKNVDSTDFLQAVTLLSTLDRKRRKPEAAIGCKRKDMLELALDEYQSWAEAATDGFEHAAKFLYDQSIVDSKDVPYRTQLVPLAAILADLGEKAGHAGVLEALRRWYWCGVLGELYGSAIESRFARDLPQVVDWMEGGPEPETITEANFMPVRLRTMRSRLSAAYKGVNALLMQGGARDFRSGFTADAQRYFDDGIDIHHIFPATWCSKQGIASGLGDCIVNKSPLSRKSNQAIGGAAPSTYVARVEKQAKITSAQMDEILATHLINPAALRSDDFGSFFRAREASLLERIEGAMGKPLAIAATATPGAEIDLDKGEPIAGTPRIPAEALGVLIVEGNTDAQYLELAAEISGRPGLLRGIHVIAGNGVNGAVQQAVLVRSHSALPIVVVFDKDVVGRGARDTLIKRFGFTKQQVVTYGEFIPGNPDDVEAEDLFPSHVLQGFVDEFGESNVLSEKVLHPQLGTWHYGFNGTGKEAIADYLGRTLQAEDVGRWVDVLELVRARLGLPELASDELVLPPPRAGRLGESDEDDNGLGAYEEVGDEGSDFSVELSRLFDAVRGGVLALGSDITEAQAKNYVAFACGRQFLGVTRRRRDLKVYMALGEDHDDPLGIVHRRDLTVFNPNSMWSYWVPVADLAHIDAVGDLARQAYENVGESLADRPWVRDGRSWHLEHRCHERGRRIVESLVQLVSDAIPDASGPNWGQKNYVSWTRGPSNWVTIGTRPNQAALVLLQCSTPFEEVAACLGLEVFDREAELSDKLALGSSVGPGRHGGVRVIVKDERDLDDARRAYLANLLQESWAGANS